MSPRSMVILAAFPLASARLAPFHHPGKVYLLLSPAIGLDAPTHEWLSARVKE